MSDAELLRRRAARERAAREQAERLAEQKTREAYEANRRLAYLNTELSAALAELRTAQRQLVQAEKMMALSQLVTGVAHEINTPLGVVLTSASQVADDMTLLRGMLSGGPVRRGDLLTLAERAGVAADLLVANAERTARLVDAFKAVAADSSSEGRTAFPLAICLGEVALGYGPACRRAGIRLEVDCPPALEMEGYRGALVETLGHLIGNALVHAFTDGAVGRVSITARPVGDEGGLGDAVELVVADDGRGIPADALPRIFDPFFTTGRGMGCIGLGLHVVFNLVTARMDGRIEVDSHLGRGARFTITLPLRAPG